MSLPFAYAPPRLTVSQQALPIASGTGLGLYVRLCTLCAIPTYAAFDLSLHFPQVRQLESRAGGPRLFSNERSA
jgi:hypothetical protein